MSTLVLDSVSYRDRIPVDTFFPQIYRILDVKRDKEEKPIFFIFSC